MNIVKKEDLSLLPVGLRVFAQRRVNIPPFKNLKQHEQKQYCLKIVTRAHASVGLRNNDPGVLAFQSTALLSCLKDKYGSLTIPEIESALEALIAGEAGEFFGLNKKSYYQALKYYYELPQRAESMKEYLKLNQEEDKPISKEEKEQIIKQALIISFEQYKQDKKFHRSFHAFHKYIKERLVTIVTDQSIKERIIKETETEYYDYCKEAAERHKRVGNRKMAKEIMSLVSMPIKENITKLNILNAKIVQQYFDDCIEGKRNIKDLK